MIDLRNIKKSHARINVNNTSGRFHIINGNLDKLGRVVLKSGVVMGDKYDKSLAKLNIIQPELEYWQKLVNTDYERSIFFPGNYGDSRFDNKEIPFCMLTSKNLSDYDVVLKHLNEQYGLSKVDYKLLHPNLLRNDVYINHYQQIHCDFDVIKPKNKLSKKTNKSFEMMQTFNKEKQMNKVLYIMLKNQK